MTFFKLIILLLNMHLCRLLLKASIKKSALTRYSRAKSLCFIFLFYPHNERKMLKIYWKSLAILFCVVCFFFVIISNCNQTPAHCPASFHAIFVQKVERFSRFVYNKFVKNWCYMYMDIKCIDAAESRLHIN